MKLGPFSVRFTPVQQAKRRLSRAAGVPLFSRTAQQAWLWRMTLGRLFR